MFEFIPITELPRDFQQDWLADVTQAEPVAAGSFKLVAVRKTNPLSYEGQRITVLVVDESGFPIPNVKVAFAYSTAEPFYVDETFAWSPPKPRKAFIVPTEGSGQIDQVQGSAVKKGEPGGVTVFILEPNFSSDIVFGMGMLGDHTGVHLTFQLRRTGVKSVYSTLRDLERRLDLVESMVK